MKRVLLVMIQPPGCSGVQGLIYNKLLPFFKIYGWEVHFAGPAPWLCSVLTEKLDYPNERLHYTTSVSFSTRNSVEKNRHKKWSLLYIYYGFWQFIFRLLERLTGHNKTQHLLHGLEKTVRRADQRWNFDLIAGKSPEFAVLSMVSRLTSDLEKPFLAMVVDPYGARDESGFYPTTPDLQKQILLQSCGAMFMSPLTLERYVEAGLVSREKAFFFTDSYPEIPWLYEANRSKLARTANAADNASSLRMIYLGMLPEWRPITALLEALILLQSDSHENSHDAHPSFELSIFGYVYPAAVKQIQDDMYLSERISIQPMVSYGDSHLLAEDTDLQLVVIGPRHLDNFPSKFFEYLGHHKPILVLGPLQNPLRQIVEDLEIGMYVDAGDAQEIASALRALSRNYEHYKNSYLTNRHKIECYSASSVAKNFSEIMNRSLARAHSW